MEFVRLPDSASVITVTLTAPGVSFAGDDAGGNAGNGGGVSVTYASGTISVVIDRAFAASRGNRIRLPLKASEPLQLQATALSVAGSMTYAAAAEVTVQPGRSATLKFDFAAAPPDASDAGDAGMDAAAAEVQTIVPMPDAAPDVAPDAAPDRPTSDAASPDTTVDAPVDTPADTGAPEVSIDADKAFDADKSLDAPPPDVPGPPIATNCDVGGLYAVSTTTTSGSPTLAVSSAGLFGVAWLGAGGNVLYNAVDAAGMLQNTADVPVAIPGGATLSAPRLASVGPDMMLAYGRHQTTGARAAVVRIAARNGAIVGAEIPGANFSNASAPPEIGGVAVRNDGTRVAVISRRAELGMATPANVDLFSSSPGLITFDAPVLLSMTRTTGITWLPSGRFLGAALMDMTSGSGRLHELTDNNLGPGRTFAFTAAPDLPVVGSGAATIAVAAAGDRIAVVWLDSQSCAGCTVREVFLATLDANGIRLGEVQVSAANNLTKSYPRVVFDGAAIAVAWLEYGSFADSQLKLRRFDTARVPVAAAINVGTRGTVALGDFGLAAAATGAYGLAYGISGGTQTLARVICTGN